MFKHICDPPPYQTHVPKTAPRYASTHFTLQVRPILIVQLAVFIKQCGSGEGHNIDLEIKTALDLLLESSASPLPLTVVFVEIPTNPDMKVNN